MERSGVLVRATHRFCGTQLLAIQLTLPSFDSIFLLLFLTSGIGNYGELGRPLGFSPEYQSYTSEHEGHKIIREELVRQHLIPAQVPGVQHIAVNSIACGGNHTLMAGYDRNKKKNVVLGCGSNLRGQLGVDPNVQPQRFAMEPVRVFSISDGLFRLALTLYRSCVFVS